MQSYNIIVLYSLSNQTHTNFPEVNEFLFIHPNPNVCTLFIQKIQLFPLEILDFFNEFLKSGIRRNEPYSEDYHKCKMYERNIPGNIQRIKFQSPCKHVQPSCPAIRTGKVQTSVFSHCKFVDNISDGLIPPNPTFH
jgi:hypothetical protein